MSCQNSDSIYTETPKVFNELINRDVLSSQGQVLGKTAESYA